MGSWRADTRRGIKAPTRPGMYGPVMGNCGDKMRYEKRKREREGRKTEGKSTTWPNVKSANYIMSNGERKHTGKTREGGRGKEKFEQTIAPVAIYDDDVRPGKASLLPSTSQLGPRTLKNLATIKPAGGSRILPVI